MLDLTAPSRPAQTVAHDHAGPLVTVLMAVFNGADVIEQSINSVLSQTLADFEFIIVDDCSSDGTERVVRRFADPRIRLIRNVRNMGAVGARNAGFALAAGRYIAPLDHDDLSRPTRLAEQVAYLEAHPDTVLVATSGWVFEAGRLRPFPQPHSTDPVLIEWLLWLKNPLVFSSTMFRADAVHRMRHFLRQEYECAEDYDLYISLLGEGRLARLDRPLTVYRLHGGNTTRTRREVVIRKTAEVLLRVYRPWLGGDADEAAALIARHIAAGLPTPDARTLDRLGGHVERVAAAFVSANALGEADRRRVAGHAARLWWQTVRAAVRGGRPGLIGRFRGHRALAGELRPGPLDRAVSLVRGCLPAVSLGEPGFGAWLPRTCWAQAVEPPRAPRAALSGVMFEPSDFDIARPPALYVVVDTEAEFDWSKPFARSLTQVSAMAGQGRAQAVFDRYGLRPVYLIDYPVATQVEGYGPLREFLARDACYVGAHLHPWTNPPLEEMPSDFNSYPGNLPPELEARKLDRLLAAIRANLGVTPLFYKAGRYGMGPQTIAAIAARGVPVDFSILPGADLRPILGPDFRAFGASPYRVRPREGMPEGATMMSLPMTRDGVGPLACLGPGINRFLSLPAAKAARLRGVLAMLRLYRMVTLTPEGVDADSQIALLRAMLRRGHRTFVLHYHSPSLMPGHTPYVRTARDADAFVERIGRVCATFFERFGGMPGDPLDFAPPQFRGLAARTATHQATAFSP